MVRWCWELLLLWGVCARGGSPGDVTSGGRGRQAPWPGPGMTRTGREVGKKMKVIPELDPLVHSPLHPLHRATAIASGLGACRPSTGEGDRRQGDVRTVAGTTKALQAGARL